MSHAMWGGGDVVVDDERLDKTPGTTIPQQAKSRLSAKVEGFKSRASNKTSPIKVEEAPKDSKSPRMGEADLEAGVGPATSGITSSETVATGGLSLPPASVPPTQSSGNCKCDSEITVMSNYGTLSNFAASLKTLCHIYYLSGSGKLVLDQEAYSQVQEPSPQRNIQSGEAQSTPQQQSSPSKQQIISPKRSRAEIVQEQLSRQSTHKSGASSHRSSHRSSRMKDKSRASKVNKGEESDKSISPSQRFTPNRGLTQAEIF